MDCPSCLSQNHSDYKKPAALGGSVYRRHRCKNCGTIFLSREQVVVDMTSLLTNGSGVTLNSEDTLLLEGEA